MKRTLLSLFAVAVLAVSGRSVSADDAKPLAVVSLSGYDNVLRDLGEIAKIANKPNLPQMIEGLAKGFTQNAGLDQKQPWGAVVQIENDQPAVYGFFPISDPKKLLEALKPMVGDVQETGEGSFLVKAPNGALAVKKKGNWTFVSVNPAWLEKTADDPAKLLGELPKQYALAVALHVANIPQTYRDLAAMQIQMAVQMSLQQQAGGDPEQLAMQKQMADKILKSLVQALNELDTVTVGLNIDGSARKVALDISVVAKAGTAMAKDMMAGAKYETVFGGLQTPGAALAMASGGQLSPSKIDEQSEMLKSFREKISKQLDDQKESLSADELAKAKQFIRDVFDVGLETLKSGYADTGVNLLLDTKSATLVGAGHIVGAAKIEKGLKDLVEVGAKEQPAVKELVKFDVETHKGVRFHTVSVPIPESVENRAQIVAAIGPTLDVALGFSDKAVFWAVGRNALATAKGVIDKSESAGKVSLPPLRLSIAMASVLGFVAQVNPQAAAQLGPILGVLAQSGGKDHIILTASSVENGARFRLELEEGLVKLLGLAPIGPGGM